MFLKTAVKLNKKGFTLIGVLVASVVGLIVMAGFSQMFVNMANRLKEMENRAASVFFKQFIGDQLMLGCENTLREGQSTGGVDIPDFIKVGHTGDIYFYQLRDGSSKIVLDLNSEKGRLEAEYGIEGHTFFQLKCIDALGCDYIGACGGAFPCSRKWSLSFISQRRTKGVLQYNRSLAFELDIEYNSNPNISANLKDFDCNTLTLSGGGGGGLSGSGYFIAKDNPTEHGLTLIGGGGTAADRTASRAGTSAYGYGIDNSSGLYNTFIGYSAGKNNQAASNTFLGYQAGLNNTTGARNNFIGYLSGEKNVTGRNNNFFGHKAGQNNTAGFSNTFVGHRAGENNTTESKITAIGFESGRSGGAKSTFIGYQAGSQSGGTGNIFIGYQAGYSTTSNDKFIVANSSTAWIEGTIGGSSLTVGGNETVNPSSRTVKKNIKPFINFDQTLKDILKTPLFTFQYREKARHPKKKRMGIIAEELPEHLQLKSKDHPPQPDWPSIYGSFWAGIKALHKIFDELKQELISKITKLEKALLQKLENFKKEFFSKLKDLNSHVTGLKDKQRKLVKELSQLKTEFSAVLRKLSEANKKLKESNNSLSAKNKKLSKELANTRARLDQINREMETTKEKLKNLEKKIAPLFIEKSTAN